MLVEDVSIGLMVAISPPGCLMVRSSIGSKMAGRNYHLSLQVELNGRMRPGGSVIHPEYAPERESTF